MSRRAARRGLVILTALLGPLALAAEYRFLTLEEIWQAADRVVLGTVQAARTEARDGEPWTRVEVQIERRLGPEPAGDPDDEDDEGGEGRDDTLAFWLLGGELPNGEAVTVGSMPRFEEGERVLLALYDDEDLASPIVGFRQGLWRLRSEGLIDERGRRLGLGEDGLARDADEGSLEEILDAVDTALEEGP